LTTLAQNNSKKQRDEKIFGLRATRKGIGDLCEINLAECESGEEVFIEENLYML